MSRTSGNFWTIYCLVANNRHVSIDSCQRVIERLGRPGSVWHLEHSVFEALQPTPSIIQILMTCRCDLHVQHLHDYGGLLQCCQLTPVRFWRKYQLISLGTCGIQESSFMAALLHIKHMMLIVDSPTLQSPCSHMTELGNINNSAARQSLQSTYFRPPIFTAPAQHVSSLCSPK